MNGGILDAAIRGTRDAHRLCADISKLAAIDDHIVAAIHSNCLSHGIGETNPLHNNVLRTVNVHEVRAVIAEYKLVPCAEVLRCDYIEVSCFTIQIPFSFSIQLLNQIYKLDARIFIALFHFITARDSNLAIFIKRNRKSIGSIRTVCKSADPDILRLRPSLITLIQPVNRKNSRLLGGPLLNYIRNRQVPIVGITGQIHHAVLPHQGNVHGHTVIGNPQRLQVCLQHIDVQAVAVHPLRFHDSLPILFPWHSINPLQKVAVYHL